MMRGFFARQDEARSEATARRVLALRAELGWLREALSAAGASSMWVFGSLCRAMAGEAASGDSRWGEPHPESDLDIAVEGLSLDGEAAVRMQLHERGLDGVDLVRLEEMPAQLRERVLDDGERL